MNRITSSDAPRPIGPYSQAVDAGGFVFVSGQIPLDPKTGELVKGGIKEQTERVLENVRAILRAAGLELSNVVYVIAFLRNLGDFNDFNDVYAKYFKDINPARTTVEVSDLPRGALVEVTVIASR